MSMGIVDATSWRRKLFAFALVAVILVCAALLVFVDDLNKSWTVAMQVISAVAGAALGSVLQMDVARSAVRNQARPAIRKIFDQASRLGELVERVERHGNTIRQNAASGRKSDSQRIADWFESIGYNLREEINSSATAIEDWGDLARDVYEAEVERYKTRHERMPIRRQLTGSQKDD